MEYKKDIFRKINKIDRLKEKFSEMPLYTEKTGIDYNDIQELLFCLSEYREELQKRFEK